MTDPTRPKTEEEWLAWQDDQRRTNPNYLSERNRDKLTPKTDEPEGDSVSTPEA